MRTISSVMATRSSIWSRLLALLTGGGLLRNGYARVAVSPVRPVTPRRAPADPSSRSRAAGLSGHPW